MAPPVLLRPTALESYAAAKTIAGHAIRTPCIRLNWDGPKEVEIFLKLENLQPIGSFKIRPGVPGLEAARVCEQSLHTIRACVRACVHARACWVWVGGWVGGWVAGLGLAGSMLCECAPLRVNVHGSMRVCVQG